MISKDYSHSMPSSRLRAPLQQAKIFGNPCFRKCILSPGLALSAVIGHFSASGTVINKSGVRIMSHPISKLRSPHRASARQCDSALKQ